MSTTWAEIKLQTLKKIDPMYNSLTPSRNTKDYLNGMVESANRGLQDLATAGKYIVKRKEITQNPVKNLLPAGSTDIFQHLNSDISYLAGGALAYYFEVDNPAVVELFVGDVLTKTITHTGTGSFTAYKGLIANPDGDTVKLNFSGGYPYQYMNVALYDVAFASDDDVFEYTSFKRYDLRDILPDFYKLVSTDVVFQVGISEPVYEKTSAYKWEGDSVLVLNGLQKGKWIVHYYSYPQKLTSQTPDEEIIELDPEVASLLPVYMAWQLYFEESPSKASQFRDEYIYGKEQLSPSQPMGQGKFVDVTGWV